MTDTPWGIINARITRVIDRLDALPTFREATVAATSPLSVRFDTDSADTLVFATLVSGLAVGDRVLTLRFGRLPWVIGRRGGQVDTGWIPLTPEPGWTIASSYHYRALSARRVGREVWIDGAASRDAAPIPVGFIATLPASIPPPPHRTPLLDHRPELGQGEVTLGDAGGNLSRVYNHTSRGSVPTVVLSGHYFID